MAQPLRIYISLTFSDLESYREAVYKALRKLRHDVIAMEDYVATDTRPLDKCLADVESCDVYVGIFAWRYGYVPEKDNPEQKSITELEYRKAGEAKAKKERLIFLLKPDAAWNPSLMDAMTGEGDRGTRIAALRAELAKEHTDNFFTTPDGLASLITAAVTAWEKSRQDQISHPKRPEVGALISVPDLPPHFLPRPEELNTLKQAVLAETNQPIVVTGAAKKVGLQGMGGIGKSMLATALACDEEVRRMFPDGVL